MSREEDLARELAEARARIAALEAHRDQILEALAVCRAQRLRAIASLEALCTLSSTSTNTPGRRTMGLSSPYRCARAVDLRP